MLTISYLYALPHVLVNSVQFIWGKILKYDYLKEEGWRKKYNFRCQIPVCCICCDHSITIPGAVDTARGVGQVRPEDTQGEVTLLLGLAGQILPHHITI